MIMWLIVEWTLTSSIDPYIPRAKRPPSYLGPFLSWLNSTIDALANKIAPCITVSTSSQRSRSCCCPRSQHVDPASLTHTDRVTATFNVFYALGRNFCCENPSRLSLFLWWRSRHRRSHVYALSSMTAGLATANSAARAWSAAPPPGSRAIFDSDSFDILVDGGATACILNSLSDFVTPPKASRVRVKGFNGTSSRAKVGTVSWPILDDAGHRHILKIPNTYYIPECPLRLFSPQHYSQATSDYRGTFSTNFGDHVLLVWDHGRYKATLPLSPTSNVGILRSAPGHAVFSCFVGMHVDASPAPALFDSHLGSDDEADSLAHNDNDIDTLSGDSLNLEGDTEGDADGFKTKDMPGDVFLNTPPPSKNRRLRS
jgi:hypothetical protein